MYSIPSYRITISELAYLLDVSVFTINRWYRWQKKFNKNVLPEPKRIGVRNYWKQEDVPILLEFKNKIIKGRNGVMTSG